MKRLIKFVVALLFGLQATAQEKTIQVELSKQNGHDSMKLQYEELADIIELNHLPCGKHRIYLLADKNCGLALDRERNKKLQGEDIEKLEKFFAGWKVELTHDGKPSANCDTLQSRSIPVSIIKTR